MRIILLCLLLFVPFISCIYKGKDVRGGNHSFVVSLQTNHGNHFCCGALITLKFILTAASCVKDKRPHEFTAVGGITNLTDTHGIRMLVDKVITANVSGLRDRSNNIALLSLLNELPSSLNLRPIDLAEDDDHADKVGEKCRIYGWGKKSKKSPCNVSNTLQNAVTEIGNQTDCRKIYNLPDDRILCIFNKKASLCDYDTGNPLISDRGYYLWGISTEIHWCGDTSNTSYYDVYTRVNWHLEWIRKTMNENSVASIRPKLIILTAVISLLAAVFNY